MRSENKVLKEQVERFGAQNKPKEGTINVDIAIEKAYADMSRRAKGHTPKVKTECLKELKKIFDEMPFFNNVVEFDKWHKASCEKLRDAKLSNDFKVTFGRAQKASS